MDDKSPNSSASQSNIDDLVKELSRPQGSPPSPASPSTQSSISQPTPMPPPRPMGPPPIASNSVPLPPRPNPAPATPVVPSVPKEYQSSIRTMSDDLSKLKAGQQPQGVNIPRKIDNTPVPVKPVVPPVTSAPAPSKLGPTVSMPSATKSAPMPSTPNQAPKPPVSTPIPRPVMPTMPQASKTPEMKSDQKNQFYVPPAAETKPASSRNLFFIIIAAVIVVFGGLYWYFFIQSPSQVAEETPTPTATFVPTATPNPDVLSTIFTIQGGTIMLPSAGDPAMAFKNGISAQPNITAGTLTAINIASGASDSAQVLTISGLLNRFVVAYPSSLPASFGQYYKFLLYGQKESFDNKGRLATGVVPGSRLVMISEVASSSVGILQGWEPTMSANLSGVMSITPSKNTGSFISTSYNGVSVRFKNFSYPDHSIDYAFVLSGGKTFMVIAGSREAMFAVIDAFTVPVR